MIKRFILFFIYLSFITKSIGGIENPNPILARITFSDVFGALALLFGLKYLLQGLMLANKTSKIYSVVLFFIASLVLLIPFSMNIESTIIETFILFFLVLISILIFYLFKDKLFDSIFPAVINTTIIAAILGFYDLIASIIGLPRLFDARNDGEVISGFRNAGQAGAYFLVFLTVLIPLFYSKLKEQLSRRYQKRLVISIVMSLLFLFSTGKIAAYIGFTIGVVFFLLQQRKFKLLGIASILSVFIYMGFLNIGKFAPSLNNRLNRKIETRIIQNYQGTNTNSFFQDNFGGAIKSFTDSPLTGSGLGAFYGNYGKYEVHSTYLKMLGEGGVFIALGYLIFILVFLNLFKNYFSKENPYENYLLLMIPFILGCLVSWSYTYHLRKREFWILVSVLVIIKYSSMVWEEKKLIKASIEE
jgi:hypothetical protein